MLKANKNVLLSIFIATYVLFVQCMLILRTVGETLVEICGYGSSACYSILLQHANKKDSFLSFLFRSIFLKTALLLYVRVERIELSPRPWQGRVLPLNHTRVGAIVATLPISVNKQINGSLCINCVNTVLSAGFEPTTTVPKTVVISISPRERTRIILENGQNTKGVLKWPYGRLFKKA